MRPPTSPLPPRPTFLNDAAMVFLRTAGAAAFLCLLYLVFGNERTGFILLGGLAIAAIAAGVISVLAYRGQLAEEMVTAPADEAPVVRSVRWSPLPAPSATPFAGAAAIVLLAAGALYGLSLTIVGVLVALITVAAVSTVLQGEHRGRPVNVMPFAIPIVALAVIASFMFLMSRMLLAVNH
ncbi:MAG: hypothetical protein JOZ68_08065, partial [Acidimicrobiia bacterium]|nr:hypothetical protein [Acidimicrobiia bacterium]